MLKKFAKAGSAFDRAQVLNAPRANVMVADAKLNITYMNSAVRALLEESEAMVEQATAAARPGAAANAALKTENWEEF
jgi:methyl-accepting chemotaxis protein